jgi:hypothetical protein
MKLSEFKTLLSGLSSLDFVLESGMSVPAHFHVTEVGQVQKRFIDCGGVIRFEKKVSFQLWEAGDFDHRLAPLKLNDIIHLSEEKLAIEDAEIEVEYQQQSISKFGLTFNGTAFVLMALTTDCLAPDRCGIPVEKTKKDLRDLQPASGSCCTPGGNCC